MSTEIQFVARQRDRLDKIVAEYLQAQGYPLTRSGLKSQGIFPLVNGKPQKLSYETCPGDVIVVELPDPKPSKIIPQPVPFSFVYKDDCIAVINKPFGVVVHPAKGHESGTLVHGLLYSLGEHIASVGGVERPGIVHRLDKDTAGLMIIALTDEAHHRLVEDFKHQRVHKIYHTIVKGHPPAHGHIDAPLGRSPHDRKKMAVVATGKPAQSDYSVLEYLTDHAFVEVKIYTGRTHQIRVHMAHIGHPVVGDPLYSRHAQRYDLPGLALCARELSFVHPITGKTLHFTIELPLEMQALLEKLRKK